MIHLPLFGCNISLQSFLLLQFQFHSNFRRSNEKATLQQSILTPTITPFLCRAGFYQKQPSPELISLESPSQTPLPRAPYHVSLNYCWGEKTFCDAICLYCWGSVLARALSLPDCLERQEAVQPGLLQIHWSSNLSSTLCSDPRSALSRLSFVWVQTHPECIVCLISVSDGSVTDCPSHHPACHPHTQCPINIQPNIRRSKIQSMYYLFFNAWIYLHLKYFQLITVAPSNLWEKMQNQWFLTP